MATLTLRIFRAPLVDFRPGSSLALDLRMGTPPSIVPLQWVFAFVIFLFPPLKVEFPSATSPSSALPFFCPPCGPRFFFFLLFFYYTVVLFAFCRQ